MLLTKYDDLRKENETLKHQCLEKDMEKEVMKNQWLEEKEVLKNQWLEEKNMLVNQCLEKEMEKEMLKNQFMELRNEKEILLKKELTTNRFIAHLRDSEWFRESSAIEE